MSFIERFLRPNGSVCRLSCDVGVVRLYWLVGIWPGAYRVGCGQCHRCVWRRRFWGGGDASGSWTPTKLVARQPAVAAHILSSQFHRERMKSG